MSVHQAENASTQCTGQWIQVLNSPMKLLSFEFYKPKTQTKNGLQLF